MLVKYTLFIVNNFFYASHGILFLKVGTKNSKLVQNININTPNFKLVRFIDKLIEYYYYCSK